MRSISDRYYFSVYALSCMVILTILSSSCSAQPLSRKAVFTPADSLRGSLNANRSWWDVTHYAITVEADIDNKTIRGKNILSFTAMEGGKMMQIDLQQPMNLQSAVYGNRPLAMKRSGNLYYIEFPESISKGSRVQLELNFYGKPTEAQNPPWDGGWIWQKDKNGHPWVSVACQGLGASVWYPCKDHQSDEPDSASLTIIVPDHLSAIGNGKLRSKQTAGTGKTAYTWAVTNPINNYNIIPYIGRYTSWEETYTGENGPLDCSYYVLDYNLEKAKKQFEQVQPMLKCFEYWFGPYPFYEDGYKLVESPHLGMEHQSAVAYGNQFENGYLGRDLSGSGWGEKFDFILIHESGHEWFGNNITTNDIADMWIHEGFTNYSEALYVNCVFGKEACSEYVIGTRKLIRNDLPVIGQYGVNHEGSGDMYYKGGNLVHMIRQIIDDDEKFRFILREMNKQFGKKSTDGAVLEAHISQHAGRDLSKIFDQYLRTTQIPTLEYVVDKGRISFRWTNCIAGFDMPVKLHAGKSLFIFPTEEWKSITPAPDFNGTVRIDDNFYIHTRQVKAANK